MNEFKGRDISYVTSNLCVDCLEINTSNGVGGLGLAYTHTTDGDGGERVGAIIANVTNNGDTADEMRILQVEYSQNSTASSVNSNSSLALMRMTENVNNFQYPNGIIIDAGPGSGDDAGIDNLLTDAIDVSDADITNAINVGANTILADNSFSIDLKKNSATTLTITNSDVSATASLAVEGDISAAGGFKNTLGIFSQQNVVANQSAVQLKYTQDNNEIVMPYAGSVVGICIAANAARSAGSITVQPRINGTGVTGLTAVLDASNTTYKCSTIAKDASGATFNAGDRVDAVITTSADWVPTTDDVIVSVIGEF